MNAVIGSTTLLVAVAIVLGVVPPAAAQDAPAPDAERERVEREVVIRRDGPSPEQEERLRAAEARLQEAAEEIAEITSRMVPGAVDYARRILISRGRPMLGVSIAGSGESDGGPVDGVQVLGVSPGSPAEQAGIRAGDLLTAIGGETLAADGADTANRRLLDALDEREPGDAIDLEISRGGATRTITVQTRDADSQAFSFLGDGDFDFEFRGDAPMVWFGSSRPWGDMELVQLTPGLGRYFGTEEGLLVVRAPSDPSLKLEDGDVIRRIGGRQPNSVAHAMRILRSYEEGEVFELEIMRQQRSRKLEVEIPASQGRTAPPAPPANAPPEPPPIPPPAPGSSLPEV